MNKILPKTLSRYLAVQAAYNLIISSEKDEIINNFNSKSTLIFIDFEKQIKKKNINKEKILKEYGVGAQILIDLGIKKITLLTKSRKNIVGIDGFGLEVNGTKKF